MSYEDKNKYFVDNVEVTRDKYIHAERTAGFYPKSGSGIATGSFTGSNGTTGRVQYG